MQKIFKIYKTVFKTCKKAGQLKCLIFKIYRCFKQSMKMQFWYLKFIGKKKKKCLLRRVSTLKSPAFFALTLPTEQPRQPDFRLRQRQLLTSEQRGLIAFEIYDLSNMCESTTKGKHTYTELHACYLHEIALN